MATKLPRGRPHWQPTKDDRDKVQAMAAFGIPQLNIAAIMGVAPKTLRTHCREELDNGTTVANAAVGRFLYDAATGKHGRGGAAVTAAIFWAKTRMGWKETTVNEHTGGETLSLRVTDTRQRNFELLDAVSKRVVDRAAGDVAKNGAQPDPLEAEPVGHA